MSKRQKKASLLSTLDEVFGPPPDMPPLNSPKEVAQFLDPPDDEEHACQTDRKLPRCTVTNKVSFPSKGSAKSALRLRQRRGAGFLRVYLCERCHHHHLTSTRFEKS